LTGTHPVGTVLTIEPTTAAVTATVAVTAAALATGWSHETKRAEVNVWVNQFGKGRVFGTTIGHYNHTLQDPAILDLLTRGLLWSTGKLQDDGKPMVGYGAK
jgi:type 1 glutamine amidotransferase